MKNIIENHLLNIGGYHKDFFKDCVTEEISANVAVFMDEIAEVKEQHSIKDEDITLEYDYGYIAISFKSNTEHDREKEIDFISKKVFSKIASDLISDGYEMEINKGVPELFSKFFTKA